MSAQIKIQTPEFRVTGDGIATSMSMSLDKYPFPANFPGSVAGVVYQTTDPNLGAITVGVRTCTIAFNSAFSGDAGPVALFISYNLS
jgi:hypothetical protein